MRQGTTRAARWAALAGLALGAAAGPPLRTWLDPAWFDGRRYHQPEPRTKGFGDWLRREWDSSRGPWREFTDSPPGPAPPACVEGGRLRVTFVNHATTLIQMDGWNVLTDPTWSDRSTPIVGVRRRRPPGLRFQDLPPIDAVLLSHDHQDHMDLPTLKRLQAAWHPVILAGLGNRRLLEKNGITGVRELNWWQSSALQPDVVVTAVPARHSSGRTLLNHDRTLWCGFVVTGPSGSVYFAGDTGWGIQFAAIGETFPHLRLALLPIGGFRPVWYMREQHTGPQDALEAYRLLGAETFVPMHFGTFPNAADGEFEPVATLRTELARSPNMAPHVVILDNGEALEVAPVADKIPAREP